MFLPASRREIRFNAAVQRAASALPDRLEPNESISNEHTPRRARF
jgi:hypothetical protein